MANHELILTGEQVQKLINNEAGDSIIEVLQKQIPDPISRLVTLTCLLASLVVSMTDDELASIQTMTELSKLQIDVITGLYASGVKEKVDMVH